jgi:hypothetical protein
MTEILINLAWIRVGKGRSRALRFLRFEPLERRAIAEDINTTHERDTAAELQAKYDKQRAELRHLFRIRDRNKKLTWAKHWAVVPSLRDRFIEAKAEEARQLRRPNPDMFMYGFYRWASSTVHGGPLSLFETLGDVGGRIRARRQPELNPTAHVANAGIALLMTIRALVQEGHLGKLYGAETRRLLKVLERGEVRADSRLKSMTNVRSRSE